MSRFVADLEAIPTDDPALRSARAVWREQLRLDLAIPLIERPCELLKAWAAAGYTGVAAPPLPFAAHEALDDRYERLSVVWEEKLG